MKHFLFILTMPNNNSWNGKWTGSNNLYCIVRSYSFRKNQKNFDASFKNVSSTNGCYYDFGDGWGAHVSIRECSAGEKRLYKKQSAGFCGYDWMVDEIEKHGRILKREEREASAALAGKGE